MVSCFYATAAMGTRFELVLVDGNPAVGELVIAEIEDWHRRLSRFAPDSWVSHVNRTAAHAPVRCDDDLWGMLVDAQDVWRASGGAFDLTRGRGDGLLLDPDARTVAFARPDMAIDLGGIGKGHAIDCAARLLREHGVTSAFIHGGTSSGAGIGVDANGQPWRVGVEGNGGTKALYLHDLAFSVSNSAAQPGGHIIDPRHSHSDEITIASDLVAIVTGPSARLADAWSTAVVVLGHAPAPMPEGFRMEAWISSTPSC